MYNVEVVCLYPYYDSELLPYCPTQFAPDFIKEYIELYTTEELSNCLYKANFLESFHLTDFNEEMINKEVKILYNKLIDNVRLKKCMKILANKYMSEDLFIGFMILFSYEYFFLTHTCICEFLKSEEIHSLTKLEEYIEKK